MKSKIDKAAADRAVTLISALRQTKGEWAGKPLNLMPWQEAIVRKLFGTLNKDGTRQYRTCYIELPRKNGKSTLAAAFANYLLFLDGEMGAEIYSAANDRDQASIVYNEAASMVEQDPALNARATILTSVKRIYVPSTRSFYRAISAEAYTKHGYNAHGVIYDELHAAPDRDLWDVLTTSVGSRRQPLVIVITTAGFDRNSICWEQHDYAEKVLKGVIKDTTFLPVIYAAPDDADWTDAEVWKACNPALGTFRNLDELASLCKKAQETPALEMTFRRLYLNQWVNSTERWLPMEAWDSCKAKVEVENLKGKPCYAGLDLASTTDLTALLLDFPRDDGMHDVLAHFWIPGETAVEKEKKDRVPYRAWAKKGLITLTEGNVVDYRSILQFIEDWLQLYDIRELAFDRWGSQKLVVDLEELGFTSDTKESGRKLISFGQGYASMSSPTKELMNLVLQKKIRHGGNPILRWNADNLVVQQDPAGNLKPDKAKATQKIDGMVALIMAISRAVIHAEDPPSIYEKRGAISL